MKKIILITGLLLSAICYSQTPHTAVIHRDINWVVTGIVFIHEDRITELSVTQHESAIDHDQLTNFADNEHRIWEITGPEDIHDDRIQESSVTQHEAAIDHDALTNFLASEHVVYVGGNGITRDGTDIDLGGALDAPTTITGTEVNDFNISMTDAGDRSGILGFDAANWWLSMRAYTGDDFTGDSGYVVVDSAHVEIVQFDGASRKSIRLDTSDRGIVIRDDDAGVGLRAFANYSTSGSPSYSYTTKLYQDTYMGGQVLDANTYSPSDAEHGYVLVYDTAGVDRYKLNEVVSVASAAGMVIEAFDTIIFSTTTIDTIVILPVGAVIWDIQVYTNTTFDGSGTNLLDVGIDGDGDKYVNDFDLENPTGVFYGLSAIPDRMASNMEIIFQYADSGADAAAGLAFVYVKYSIPGKLY